jgi:hypothetical protein
MKNDTERRNTKELQALEDQRMADIALDEAARKAEAAARTAALDGPTEITGVLWTVVKFSNQDMYAGIGIGVEGIEAARANGMKFNKAFPRGVMFQCGYVDHSEGADDFFVIQAATYKREGLLADPDDLTKKGWLTGVINVDGTFSLEK